MPRFRHQPRPQRVTRSSKSLKPSIPIETKTCVRSRVTCLPSAPHNTVNDGSSSNPFHDLPTELMHEVAHYLDADLDLCNFQLSFKYARSNIDNDHFWQKRFTVAFDIPRPDSFIKSGPDFGKQYKQRKRMITHMPDFHRGNSPPERQCLAMLRDMMCDAYAGRASASSVVFVSKNIEDHVKTFLTDSNLLEEIFAARYAPKKYHNQDILQDTYNPLMRMLQVMMAPSLLDPRPFPKGPQIVDFSTSQYMAYSGAKSHPIFRGCNGTDVDFDWCLHQLNFWRTHMLREDEASLNSIYKILADDERPQYWHTLLQNDNANYIGRKWKGSYAFLDQRTLHDVRKGAGEIDHIIDEFNGNESRGEFQDLELQFTEDDGQAWHPQFERILRSLAKPPEKRRTRAQKANSPAMMHSRSRSFRFGGEGEDVQRTFLADGWLSALPPQHEVPGWQRMTMMKYFVDVDTNEIDWSSLWAYEGVALPGGQVIIGRWWSPINIMAEDEAYSGPFLFWCVDDPKKDFESDATTS